MLRENIDNVERHNTLLQYITLHRSYVGSLIDFIFFSENICLKTNIIRYFERRRFVFSGIRRRKYNLTRTAPGARKRKIQEKRILV